VVALSLIPGLLRIVRARHAADVIIGLCMPFGLLLLLLIFPVFGAAALVWNWVEEVCVFS